MKRSILFVFVIVSVFSSCTKNNSALPKPDASLKSLTASPALVPILPVNVYTCGFIGYGPTDVACYWRNGVVTRIDSGSIAVATAITMVGPTIYIAGVDHTLKPVYWVNGVAHMLPTTSTYVYPTAIAVSGSDVYVTASEQLASVQNAVLWKNGVRQSLGTSSTIYSTANGLFINGTDVYVAGTSAPSGQSIACYWKNGVLTHLSTARVSSLAKAISVSGSNVYVCGQSNNKMVYWVNGTINVLPDLGYGGLTSDILVNGTDVYVSGNANLTSGVSSFSNAVYWKNGVATYNLTYGAASTTYNKMAFTYGTLYFGGMFVPQVHSDNGVYWKGASMTYVNPDGYVTGLTTSPY